MHGGCLLVFYCFIGVIATARGEEMGVNLLLMEKEGGKASGNIWRSCVLLVVVCFFLLVL